MNCRMKCVALWIRLDAVQIHIDLDWLGRHYSIIFSTQVALQQLHSTIRLC